MGTSKTLGWNQRARFPSRSRFSRSVSPRQPLRGGSRFDDDAQDLAPGGQQAPACPLTQPISGAGPAAVKPSASAPSAASCEAVGWAVAGSRSYVVPELVAVGVTCSTLPVLVLLLGVGAGEDASEASARSRRRRGR